jgi:transposase-like protein
MSGHFLLSAAARTISLRQVYAGGEQEAFEQFKKLRWPQTGGEPICPRCGSFGCYDIATRRKHKCKACSHQFSVTSGTILASRKMAFADLLAAIVILANAAKGVSMLQLSRDLDCQYKTAFVLAHKLREAIALEIKDATLSGTVEIDGAYFGGHIRPANLKENRIDRRLAENQTGKRRVVAVARERQGRTAATVTKSEADGVAFVESAVASGSILHADEASHWDALHAKFKTHRINHSQAYSLNGACTNQAESFLARLRRMVGGQHHHVAPQYLHQFANEAAWKEDRRRLSNGELSSNKLALAMAHPVSRVWAGYWQRAN